jgi:AcrR family transcriptional regulator
MPRQRINLDSVLDEAAAVVDNDGRDELSLGRLADGLGVQASALYNHVDGIDGLWHDLAVHATENLAAALRDSLVAKSGPDAVRALAHAYRDFAHEHPGQFASTLLPPVDALDTLAEAQARIVDLFVTVMHTLDIDGEQAVHSARLARSAIHGFVSLESIGAMTRPVDRTESFERLVDFILAVVTP